MSKHRSWQFTAVQEAVRVSVLIAFLIAAVVGITLLQNLVSNLHGPWEVFAVVCITITMLAALYGAVAMIGRRR